MIYLSLLVCSLILISIILSATVVKLNKLAHRLTAEENRLKQKKEMDELAFNAIYQQLVEFNKQSYQLRVTNERVDLIYRLFDIGLDISHPGNLDRSWVVICLNGKSEYVQYLDLSPVELRHIQEFLSQFRGSTLRVDAPPHMKRFFSIL